MTKRVFSEIRRDILRSLSAGQKTVNQISTEAEINWKTVDRHIIHLLGRRQIEAVFVSEYVRIYKITQEGIDALEKTK